MRKGVLICIYSLNEDSINCRLFVKHNSLTLFHCSLMFKAKCEYWACSTHSYVDFVTYIILVVSYDK